MEIRPSRISDLIFGMGFEGVVRFWLVFFGQFYRCARKHPLGTAVPRSCAPRLARGLPLSPALPDSSPYQGEPFWDGFVGQSACQRTPPSVTLRVTAPSPREGAILCSVHYSE